MFERVLQRVQTNVRPGESHRWDIVVVFVLFVLLVLFVLFVLRYDARGFSKRRRALGAPVSSSGGAHLLQRPARVVRAGVHAAPARHPSRDRVVVRGVPDHGVPRERAVRADLVEPPGVRQRRDGERVAIVRVASVVFVFVFVFVFVIVCFFALGRGTVRGFGGFAFAPPRDVRDRHHACLRVFKRRGFFKQSSRVVFKIRRAPTRAAHNLGVPVFADAQGRVRNEPARFHAPAQKREVRLAFLRARFRERGSNPGARFAPLRQQPHTAHGLVHAVHREERRRRLFEALFGDVGDVPVAPRSFILFRGERLGPRAVEDRHGVVLPGEARADARQARDPRGFVHRDEDVVLEQHGRHRRAHGGLVHVPRHGEPGVFLYHVVQRARNAPPRGRDGPAGRQTAQDVRADAHAPAIELSLPERTPGSVLASRTELDVRVQRLEDRPALAGRADADTKNMHVRGDVPQAVHEDVIPL